MAWILLVENQSFLGRLLAIYLLEAGFDVAKVDRPDEVDERLGRAKADLIVFNTGLPAEEKSAFIKRWRERVPDQKILEISEDPLIRSPSIKPDEVGAADAYLPLPFDWAKLPEFIVACLEGASPNPNRFRLPRDE